MNTLSPPSFKILERLNLVAPFAIQKQAIPAIMCGRDLIGVAKTGMSVNFLLTLVSFFTVPV